MYYRELTGMCHPKWSHMSTMFTVLGKALRVVWNCPRDTHTVDELHFYLGVHCYLMTHFVKVICKALEPGNSTLKYVTQ